MLAFPHDPPGKMTKSILRYVRSVAITAFPPTHAGSLRGWEGAGGAAEPAASAIPGEGAT